MSVGDYDLVKDVLNELEAEIRFWKVAVRPGQPVTFGIIDGTLSLDYRVIRFLQWYLLSSLCDRPY